MVDAHTAAFISSLAPPGATVRILLNASSSSPLTASTLDAGVAGTQQQQQQQVPEPTSSTAASSIPLLSQLPPPPPLLLPSAAQAASAPLEASALPSTLAVPPPRVPLGASSGTAVGAEWSFPYTARAAPPRQPPQPPQPSSHPHSQAAHPAPPLPPSLPAPSTTIASAVAAALAAQHTPLPALLPAALPATSSFSSRLAHFATSGRWACTHCYFETNPPFSLACAMCETPNTLALGEGAGRAAEGAQPGALGEPAPPLQAHTPRPPSPPLKVGVCAVCAWDHKCAVEACAMCASAMGSGAVAAVAVVEAAAAAAVAVAAAAAPGVLAEDKPGEYKEAMQLQRVESLPPPSPLSPRRGGAQPPTSSTASAPPQPIAGHGHLLHSSTALLTDPWRTRHQNAGALGLSLRPSRPAPPALLAALSASQAPLTPVQGVSAGPFRAPEDSVGGWKGGVAASRAGGPLGGSPLGLSSL